MPGINTKLARAGFEFPWLDGAIDFVTSLGVATPESVRRMSEEMAASTFTASGIDSIETLYKLKDTLADIVRSGQGAVEGAKRLREVANLRAGQAENIVRTGTKQAYMEQWSKTIQKPAIKRAFGYVKYVSTHDGRTRPWHRALDGFVCSVDDPAYKVLWDVQHENNCRCLLINLTEQQAIKAGIKTFKDLPNIAALRLIAS